jgi:hypothetical protein
MTQVIFFSQCSTETKRFNRVSSCTGNNEILTWFAIEINGFVFVFKEKYLSGI